MGRILVYGLMQRLGIAEAVETPIADFALGLEFFAGAGGGGQDDGEQNREDPVLSTHPTSLLTRREWARVFGDPSRRILSVHDDGRQHIGECTFSLDGDGGAEISVLIGRKEIWHRGYGTATVIELLDNVLNRADLQWVWVSVPEDNPAAQGLFRKLGFVPGGTAELCKGRDGSVHRFRAPQKRLSGLFAPAFGIALRLVPCALKTPFY